MQAALRSDRDESLRRGITILALNFCGLDIGAAGQRLAGNAGREAKIILDTRARARACPPKARASRTMTERPSEAA